jgi:UDP-glucose 4-epimerase
MIRRTERIVAIDLDTPETRGPKTRMYPVDLTTPTSEERVAEILAAEKVDTLLHLAFLSSPTHASAWAHELESVGTMHVLNAARQVSLRKLILWSQTILYGAHPTNPNFLSERHPLRADADEPFFGDKMAAEREAAAFAAKAKGTVVTTLRTAPIVGPRSTTTSRATSRSASSSRSSASIRSGSSSTRSTPSPPSSSRSTAISRVPSTSSARASSRSRR